VAAPGGEGCDDGLGDILLIDGIGDRGWVAVGGDEWGDLNGDRGAEEVIEGPQGGAAENHRELGALEGQADLVGEAEALRDGVCLGGVPWDCGVGFVDVGWRSKRGGDDVNAVAAAGRVKDEAGGGVAVVADLSALIGGEGNGRIGIAGGDDGESAGAERGAEPGSEDQGKVFFEHVVGEMGAGVRASVRWIEEDDGAGGGLLGRDGKRRQEDDGEMRGDVLEGRGQGRLVDCKRAW